MLSSFRQIFFKPVISVLVMGLAVYLFRNINLFLVILTGVIVYSGMVLLLKVFSKEDIKMFREVLRL